MIRNVYSHSFTRTGSVFNRMPVALLLLFLLSVVSCGPRAIGRGVLLWAPEDLDIPGGAAVEILSESELRGSYQLRYVPGGEEDGEQIFEAETWRVRRIDDRDELESARERYAEFAPYFGVAEIQALPVRDSMGTGPSSSIIYRMRQGEQAKIISRSEDVVPVGGLEDYWFEILTSDGTRGYVYGYRLDVVDAQGVSTEKTAASEDAFLDAVLNSVWRPDYFAWMINDNVYDLTRFKDEYRFEHDGENRTFTLNTREISAEFPYEEVFRARYKEYVVAGTSLQITTFSENSISIQFTRDGETIQESLVRIDRDVSEIIENERQRREDVKTAFLSMGKSFRSSQYGSMQFSEDGSLEWRGYNALDSSILPSWFQGRGDLAFNLYLARDLRSSYDGAVSITRPGISISESLNFLYRRTDQGIQLEFVPGENIDRNVILKQALTPFVIFFSIQE
ncbi:SH3 domain-containing protein [Salinispira pacifica]|uniref:SH3b domain-containing protein n=1 Tax=Salinispira pacifica TaxID=1307761 RepID=V5WIC6_9SPIO|nr:SH3 domain-containing protein [Salinispira pacifica]AHC15567.1 hypothetical protein L21SP2_2204 [Salinispira pacifica]